MSEDEISFDDDSTRLMCSRCRGVIVTYPGNFLNYPTISTLLALDLIKLSVRHGFECPGRAK